MIVPNIIWFLVAVYLIVKIIEVLFKPRRLA